MTEKFEQADHSDKNERVELPATEGSIKKLKELVQPFVPPADPELKAELAYDGSELRAGDFELHPARIARLVDGRLLWVAQGKTRAQEAWISLLIIDRSEDLSYQVEKHVMLWTDAEGEHISPTRTIMVNNGLAGEAEANPDLASISAEDINSQADAELMEAARAGESTNELELQDLIHDVTGAEEIDPFG